MTTVEDTNELKDAVHAAFVAEGYINSDGDRDIQQVRDVIYDFLATNKVTTLKERYAKAASRGAIVEAVFPSLPAPEDDQSDLAREVRKELGKFVWAECTTGAGSKMQRMVGANMGNGYVLCRTKIGRDSLDAVYITTDRLCIERDLVGPTNAAVERTVRRAQAERQMLIERKPADGQRWVRSLDQQMKQLTSSAHDGLVLALEAAKANAADEVAEDEVEVEVVEDDGAA